MSAIPTPLHLIKGFANCSAAAADRIDDLAIADEQRKDSCGPTDIGCFLSRDGESEWSEQHSAWKTLNPTPYAIAPHPSSNEFLKELADMLSKTKEADPLTLSDLKTLETGFEATSFHTKSENGKFQALWVAFRFESGKLYLSTRTKPYSIEIDLFEDSDTSKDWPYRLDEKGVEEKTEFLLHLDVVFLQFKIATGLKKKLSMKTSKQYATLCFEKKEEGELITKCLDLLVKKSDYAQMRKKYPTRRRSSVGSVASTSSRRSTGPFGLF